MMDAVVPNALAWTLIHFLWQGSIIGLLAAVSLWALRPRSTVRYAIGVGALAAMLAAPAVTFSLLLEAQPPAGTDMTMSMAPAADQDAATPVAPLDGIAVGQSVVRSASGASAASIASIAAVAGHPAVVATILAVWLTGVLFLSLRLLGGLVVARRHATRAVRPVSPQVQRIADSLAARLALRRAVRVFESTRVAVPMMMGWLKPVVLLPTAALAGLSPTQLEALLAHELAHVRRHDYLVNLLQSVVETLLFYHPAVWWVSRQVRADREDCCDDLAVAVCDRVAYASALADLAATRPAHGLALAATDGRLVDRVRRILRGPDAAAPTSPSWAVLGVTLLVGVALPVALVTASVREEATQVATATTTPSTQSAETAPLVSGHGSWSHSNSGDRIELKWTGGFRLTPDEKDIAWVEPGTYVRISNGANWLQTGVEITGLADGTLERRHYSRAFSRPWEPDGRVYLEAGIQKLIKRLGVGAEARVARFLRQGGTAAVLTEIDTLETDSARRRYFNELVKQADLTPDAVVDLVKRASASMGSDSYRSSLLEAAALRVAGSEAARVSLIAATRGIESDSYQRRTLGALLQDRPSVAVSNAVIAAVEGIDSDSYRSAVLVDLVEKGGVTDETSAAFFAQVGSMNSSSYQGRVLRAVGERPGQSALVVGGALDTIRSVESDSERRRAVQALTVEGAMTATTAPRVLSAAASVESDSYRAAMLQDFVAAKGLTNDTAPQFFPLVTSMSSSSYQRRVLEAVLEQPSVPPAVLTGLLRAVPGVESDSERSKLLLAVALKHRLTAADRELYLQAADKIESETYQTRVLAALVRAERGR